MQKRENIEKLEESILAPYAMKSKDSSGRIYKELSHVTRTCYQRDRDRIVHSEAFRKLEHKTQVFAVSEGDYYRTRLTHTIEVAQIARTIGRNLQLNEDLIEAIALAHDLGHPPFGHAGEKVLEEIMKTAKVGSFNHNFHSYEIVSECEKRYPDFNGLNLTEEVLVGLLKHQTDYDKRMVVPKYRNKGATLEAKVVDIADALAYLSHDIDDGLTSGCVESKDLMDSKLWEKASLSVKIDDKDMFKYHVVRSLIDLQIKDLLAQSEKNLKSRGFKTSKDAKKYNLNPTKGDVISFSPLMRKERGQLQKTLHKKFYEHYRVLRMAQKARRVINDLFNVYRERPEQLPYLIYDRNQKYSRSEKYTIICNYIASMTDRFVLDEHKKLFDPYQKV
ncbi:MAG: deoxyguanosinetriphosphate triphosphohydrolase [Candidatus Zapsychrus exili]|nr:deoxyguanosinetriphosphate triphosphohydrolase [Candidatus Zapsychrus exili]